MSQQVASRDGSIDGDPPAPPEHGFHRRRRWRRFLVPIIVLALLVVTVFLVRYQPLVPGSAAAGAVPGGRFAMGPSGPMKLFRIPFHNGAVVTYGFSLRNDGPLGVTITGVTEPLPPGGVLRVLGISVSRSDQGGASRDPADYSPFRAVSIGNGHERFFLVRAQFVHCESLGAGTSTTYGSIPVTYRVLDIPHHTLVPMALPIQVDGVQNACASG